MYQSLSGAESMYVPFVCAVTDFLRIKTICWVQLRGLVDLLHELQNLCSKRQHYA